MLGTVTWRFHSPPGMGMMKKMVSESVIMADDSSSYISSSDVDSSPGSPVDEYSSMRADVDQMSYEELLALGDMIGYVCTGIPEDLISECLTAKEYNVSDQNQGRSCSICSDIYKIKDETGVIKNCGHEYHASCIKKWLLMKNVCPLCKCAPLTDPPKRD